MIEKTNLNGLEKKPVKQIHGEKVLYQIVWGIPSEGPALMKRLTSVARLTIPPGETNLLHDHRTEEQAYVVVQGRGAVQVGDETTDAEPGDVVLLPAGVPHAFHNTSGKPCVVLNVSVRVS